LGELFPFGYTAEGVLEKKIPVKDNMANFMGQCESVSARATFLHKSIDADSG